ncbi:uncharacterized protein K452DRAFT_61232 [Aplosporella prunicola CBS 121167]|uniref:Uncharacterized protein n=1 Tax=Aplosporella prunicola CBS 121167 TaxID=1176127 RepID=A0A6A6B8A1_9PEZI|nr:uncharacterized protein K452DRAFT_61232 [Aplosporella prunicola CBS 121167]KAF2139495.1 hypothetical protein K452DRAFT_61232 [Aplosporella prunicola CBS 121167]
MATLLAARCAARFVEYLQTDIQAASQHPDRPPTHGLRSPRQHEHEHEHTQSQPHSLTASLPPCPPRAFVAFLIRYSGRIAAHLISSLRASVRRCPCRSLPLPTTRTQPCPAVSACLRLASPRRALPLMILRQVAGTVGTETSPLTHTHRHSRANKKSATQTPTQAVLLSVSQSVTDTASCDTHTSSVRWQCAHHTHTIHTYNATHVLQQSIARP